MLGKRRAYRQEWSKAVGERMGWLGREQTADSNLTAIHQSSNCVTSSKKCCSQCLHHHPHKYSSKKVISVRIKKSKWTCIWLIFQFPVWKWDFFVCWQITNVCHFPLYFSGHCSCAAGYHISAWRARMEDLSYKWGKEGSFWFLPLVLLSSASINSIILILTAQNR